MYSILDWSLFLWICQSFIFLWSYKLRQWSFVHVYTEMKTRRPVQMCRHLYWFAKRTQELNFLTLSCLRDRHSKFLCCSYVVPHFGRFQLNATHAMMIWIQLLEYMDFRAREIIPEPEPPPELDKNGNPIPKVLAPPPPAGPIDPMAEFEEKEEVVPKVILPDTEPSTGSVHLLWDFECEITAGRNISCMAWNKVKQLNLYYFQRFSIFPLNGVALCKKMS